MAGEITCPSSAPSDLHQISPCNCCCSSQIVSLSNIAHHLITIKLGTPTNYPFWRTLISLLLEGQNIMGFVDGTHQRPPPTHSSYAQWVRQDRLVMSLLVASLSEDVFPKVIGLETSRDIWVTLEKALADNGQRVQIPAVQTCRVSQMNPILYESAQFAKLDVLRQNKDQLHAQLTPNNNTLLHILAQFHDSAECVDEILGGQSSSIMQSMLLSKNSKGETALHIAARNGRPRIVRALIEHARALDNDQGIESGAKITQEVMRATDENAGDTALHMAVRSKHAHVVQILVEEDPDFPHPSNKMEETPLYIAIESNSHEMVASILKTCKSPSYNGPGGKSALHAAVIFDRKPCIEELLGQNQGLTKEVDEFGWSPLHYAARFNYALTATELLKFDRSAAYIMATKDDNRTPLHVAACEGNAEVMQVLLNHCPDCWEMVTSKARNILHVAVDNESKTATSFILSNSWAANLINEKDIEGNTPLHLYATSYKLGMKSLVEHLGADTNAFNGQNLTPLDIIDNLEHFSYNEKDKKAELKKKGGTVGCRNVIERDRHYYRRRKEFIAKDDQEMPEGTRKPVETVLIVATLIATITFAAGFTVPGGYDGNEGPNQGLPALTRKAAFKAFIVSDAIALTFSVLAVLLHLVASMYSKQDKFITRYGFALILVIFSTVAMTVAFMTGLYTVLAPSSLGLAIAVCFLASFAILIVFWILYLFLKD